ADLEDRSRRDNIRIINLPEGVEGKTNLKAYILGSLPVWLPALAEAKPEIMRAHRIGPPNNTGRPCTVIAKMLRYTDRDLLLRTSRKSSIKVDGKDIRFAADYSAFTTNRRCSFVEVIKKAQKIGFQTFLMYPAQLKLTRGLTQRIFKSHLEVEDFLGGLATQENVEGEIMTTDILHIATWNVNGLNSPIKRTACLDYLYRHQVDVAFIQESHLKKSDVQKFSKLSGTISIFD
ncbi:putative follistatin-related protein 5-like, partial [Triplophysa rosa]